MTSSRSDHGNLPANQIVRQRRQTIDLIVGPAVFDRHVDHTFRTKALPSWDSTMRWNNLSGGLAVG
jgi:hypothetical protein